jgi:hypothetical protein
VRAGRAAARRTEESMVEVNEGSVLDGEEGRWRRRA